MAQKKVSKLKIKKKSNTLKNLGISILLLTIVLPAAFFGYAKYTKYAELGKPRAIIGKCFVSQESLTVMRVIASAEGSYGIQGLILGFLPFTAKAEYRKFNTDLDNGKVKEIPCGE